MRVAHSRLHAAMRPAPIVGCVAQRARSLSAASSLIASSDSSLATTTEISSCPRRIADWSVEHDAKRIVRRTEGQPVLQELRERGPRLRELVLLPFSDRLRLKDPTGAARRSRPQIDGAWYLRDVGPPAPLKPPVKPRKDRVMLSPCFLSELMRCARVCVESTEVTRLRRPSRGGLGDRACGRRALLADGLAAAAIGLGRSLGGGRSGPLPTNDACQRDAANKRTISGRGDPIPVGRRAGLLDQPSFLEIDESPRDEVGEDRRWAVRRSSFRSSSDRPRISWTRARTRSASTALPSASASSVGRRNSSRSGTDISLSIAPLLPSIYRFIARRGARGRPSSDLRLPRTGGIATNLSVPGSKGRSPGIRSYQSPPGSCLGD
jgi:hypothetical protein